MVISVWFVIVWRKWAVMSRLLSLWAESINSITDEFQLVCFYHTCTHTHHTHNVNRNAHCNCFSEPLTPPLPRKRDSALTHQLWKRILFSSVLLLLYSKSTKLHQIYKPCKIDNVWQMLESNSLNNVSYEIEFPQSSNFVSDVCVSPLLHCFLTTVFSLTCLSNFS